MQNIATRNLFLATVIVLNGAMLFPEGMAHAGESSDSDDFPPSVVLWGGGTRIPSLDITPKGTLLAFAQRGGGDNHPNHIQTRRSTDSGKTWSKVKSFHNSAFKGKKVTCANPCPLVDHKTGEVWIFWAVRTVVGKEEGGLQMEGLFFSHSTDDGVTWSKPAPFLVNEKLAMGYSTTSRGIQLSSGRLLAAFTNASVKGARCSGAPRLIYSDDHGKTWKFGKPVPLRQHSGNSTEFNLLELADGRVYMNHRTAYGDHRWTSFSKDGGITWSKSQFDEQMSQGGKNGCHAGLVRLTHPKRHDKGRVLYSYPFPNVKKNNRWIRDPEYQRSSNGRWNLLIRVSYDECKTWRRTRLLQKGHISYSNLIMLPDKSIGCIYEYCDTSRKIWYSIRFTRFTWDWLTKGKNPISEKKAKEDRPEADTKSGGAVPAPASKQRVEAHKNTKKTKQLKQPEKAEQPKKVERPSASAASGATAETELAKLAKSMKPGELKRLKTKNYNWDMLKSHYDWEKGLSGAHTGYQVIQWSHDADWDPVTQQLFYYGLGHFASPKFIAYSAEKNEWRVLELPPWSDRRKRNDKRWPVGHSYDRMGLDVKRRLYVVNWNGLHLYNIDTKKWSYAKGSGAGGKDAFQVCEYFPELNSFIYESNWGRSLKYWNAETGKNGSAGSHQFGIHGIMEYNPVHKVMVFGAGDIKDRPHSGFFLMNAERKVRKLKTPPVHINCRIKSVMVCDPVSGEYIVKDFKTRRSYAYHPILDEWKKIPLKIPSGLTAALPDHGVIMFCPTVKGFSGKKPHDCLLYKHKRQWPEEDRKTEAGK